MPWRGLRVLTISVVIPCYNSGRTIRDALRSVQAQTVRPDEVIVVDDGSRDETAAIVEREFPWCRLIRQVNAGPGAARNRGVAEAKGDWIAFLDGDDAWLPDRLAIQRAASRAMPDVGLWCGGTAPLVSAPDGTCMDATPRADVADDLPSELLELRRFAVVNPVATSSVLVRKDAFARAGGFDETLRGPEDYDLWIRVAAGCPVRMIARPLALYRRVEGSLSLNDAAFLPQVLRVIEKAYGPGGCLQGVGSKRKAMGYQHLAACWSAATRGDRLRAARLYLRGVVLWPLSYRPEWNMPLARLKLLCRILGLKRGDGTKR